ncbi:unnamed protein product [Spodoptera littoralis]|uniref:Cuticular protein n=1 Tax=Spodoptera littoralis TaxID=7109 RepID=A0A9P0IFH4_SPOLI|nr:unnamed protein product [Spodoptera littoralis]CAH1646650.1 unnamed protein product [Spodoptera littoralis]
MNYNLLWIVLLILSSYAASLPVPNQYDLSVIGLDHESMNNSPKLPKYEDSPDSSDEKVISVRITSSVAVGRGKPMYRYPSDEVKEPVLKDDPPKVSISETQTRNTMTKIDELMQTETTNLPPNLVGANIEYLKQINAKKESREHNSGQVYPMMLPIREQNKNDDETLRKTDEYEESILDVPLARKVPSTADANRFEDQKSIQRFRNTEMNSPVESYLQSQHNDTTRAALFQPSVELVSESSNKDDQNVTNITTIYDDDLQTDHKETRNTDLLTAIRSFTSNNKNDQSDDSVAEPSIKSVEFAKYNEAIENIPPTATMLPGHSSNNLQGFTNRPLNDGRSNPRLTTVSFNIVHDAAETTNDNEPSTSYITSSQVISNPKPFYDPPKIYSQPAQIYSEPAKFYSEPAKVYSEPAKIYSEPAKIYSEPAKIYSEPSKFYSEPASLHLNENVPSSIAPNYSLWQRQPQTPFGSSTVNTTPISTVNALQQQTTLEHQPEKNYEVDEKISVLTDGRSHGVQPDTSTEKCKQDNCKVGYVLEGRQFKKYRVEERTPDGFIVGEYGVVRNEDGALRGVRYTADSDASPRLIHDALMKFLQLT